MQTKNLHNGQTLSVAAFTGEVLPSSNGEVWLRCADGKDQLVDLAPVGFSALEGHMVSVVVASLSKADTVAVIAARNHSTADSFVADVSNRKVPDTWVRTTSAYKGFLHCMLVGAAGGALLGTTVHEMSSMGMSEVLTMASLGACVGFLAGLAGAIAVPMNRAWKKVMIEVTAVASTALAAEVARHEGSHSNLPR